jgi:hypothetical protein
VYDALQRAKREADAQKRSEILTRIAEGAKIPFDAMGALEEAMLTIPDGNNQEEEEDDDLEDEDDEFLQEIRRKRIAGKSACVVSSLMT